MVWEISYSTHKRAVIIKTRGDIPYDDLPDQFQEAARLAQEVQTSLFLFDDTELHINVSTLDILEIPQLVFATGIPRSSRIAVVISPEENRIDNYKFLETVCVNQGLNVKIFATHAEAFAWLHT